MASSSVQRVVVYGGCGSLGTVLVSHFRSHGWWVCSIDLAINEEADENVIVDAKLDWCAQEALVADKVRDKLGEEKLVAILNVAGGWAGGSVDSPDFVKNADLMWKQSVWSSCISASLAAKHLKPGGVILLPGAKPAMKGTPGMIGYGMAKAAVHQLVKSLSCDKSGLPEGSLAVALLPVTLDTPMNRKFMPKADFSSWTSLEFVARLLHDWADGRERPNNGSLVQLITKDGETKLLCE